MERSQIDLEKFFERDILQFLDDKAGQKAGTEKETIFQKAEAALKKHDTETVLNIFEDLTNKYNSVSKDSAYKSMIYSDILELIELAKKNAKQMDAESELAATIKDISENKEIKEGELPEVITAFQKIKVERARRKIKEEEKTYKSQADLENKRQKVSKELFMNIRKKNLAEAIQGYKTLKELFETYPSKFDSAKEEFYNDILSFYMQIKRMKEDMASRNNEDFKVEVQKFKEQSEVPPVIDASKIKEIMFEIKQDVNKKDFGAAKTKIIDLKHMASKIPDKSVRNILETKIETVNQNIEFARRMSEQKT